MPNPMDMQASASGYEGYTQDLNGQWYDPNGNPIRKIDIVPWESTGSKEADALANDRVIQQWAHDRGYALNSETMDYIYNQFFTEKNNESAWQRTMDADNTKYQRAVKDMQAAGLNPFLLMSGGASGAGTSSPGSVGSGSISSLKGASKQSSTNQLSAIIQSLTSIASTIALGLLLKK